MADDAFLDFADTVNCTDKRRKRKRQSELWKKNANKSIKYKKVGKHPSVACSHTKGVCKAHCLTSSDIRGACIKRIASGSSREFYKPLLLQYSTKYG